MKCPMNFSDCDRCTDVCAIKAQRAQREAQRLRRQLDADRPFVAGKITRPSWDLLRAPLPQVQARFRA